MSGKTILDRFIPQNPLAVLTKCVMSALMSDELDAAIEQNRSRQHDDTLKFSTVALSAEREPTDVEQMSQYQKSLATVAPLAGMLTAIRESV